MVEVLKLKPFLRFSEFKDIWKKNTIGEVSRIYGRIGYRGYTVQDIVKKGKGAITLSPSNFINNHIDISKSTYISWEKHEESPEIKIYNRDILFVKTGSTFGKTAFVEDLNEPATINPQIVVLKNITIHNEFLSYVITLPIIRKQVEAIVVGGAIPTMSQKELSKMVFYLPQLPEQQKIASFLSDIDAKITQLAKKKALLEQYKKGVMQKIFSQELSYKDDVGEDYPDWQEKKIQELINEKGILGMLDGNHGELYPKSKEFTNEGIPYLAANNLVNGKVDFSECKRLPLQRASKFKKGIAVNGDVLFAHNATVGPTALLNTELEYVILSTTVTYYRCNNQVLLNSYLLYCFYSDFFIKQYTRVMSQSTRNQVPITMQKKFSIKLPCIEEQTKIANFLSDIDTKIEVLNTKIENTTTFKKGLLQKIFV